jgi:hypothetical protein
MSDVRILESTPFERWVRKKRLRKQVETLKTTLWYAPEQGSIVMGTGGLRKIRMAVPGRGKSGGARVIYYLIVDPKTLILMRGYLKNEQSDLDKDEYDGLVALAQAEEKQARKSRTEPGHADHQDAAGQSEKQSP